MTLSEIEVALTDLSPEGQDRGPSSAEIVAQAERWLALTPEERLEFGEQDA